MADQKITQLTPLVSADGADLIPIVSDPAGTPVTQSITVANLLAGAGTGTVTHTGALTANAVVVGNGTDDITVLASLGTTTTLLHGNAAGAPTFGAVVTNDITAAAVTLTKVANAAGNDKLLGSGNAGSGASYTEIALGGGLTMTGTTLSASGTGGTVTTYSVGVTVDGGGSPITTGFVGVRRLPQAGTIARWSIMADQAGDIEFDVYADAPGTTYPPTTSITASAPPALTGGTNDFDDDTGLSGWDITMVANDVMGFEVVSTSGTIERVTLQLDIVVT